MVTRLQNKISAAEVSNGSGQTRSSPDEAEEEGTFVVVEFFHDLPEPVDETRRAVNALVGGHRLEQIQWNVRTATGLEKCFRCDFITITSTLT